MYWLVVWNMAFIFPYVGNVIIPTDELTLFRGVGIPPTSTHIYIYNYYNYIYIHVSTISLSINMYIYIFIHTYISQELKPSDCDIQFTCAGGPQRTSAGGAPGLCSLSHRAMSPSSRGVKLTGEIRGERAWHVMTNNIWIWCIYI